MVSGIARSACHTSAERRETGWPMPQCALLDDTASARSERRWGSSRRAAALASADGSEPEAWWLRSAREPPCAGQAHPRCLRLVCGKQTSRCDAGEAASPPRALPPQAPGVGSPAGCAMAGVQPLRSWPAQLGRWPRRPLPDRAGRTGFQQPGGALGAPASKGARWRPPSQECAQDRSTWGLGGQAACASRAALPCGHLPGRTAQRG